jgi:hypothetical protein
MSQRSKKLPGEGFLGWLGRQVGYVSKAVKHPVPGPSSTDLVDASQPAQTIYRDRKVIEQPMPGRPEVVLRRTVIDEAVLREEGE